MTNTPQKASEPKAPALVEVLLERPYAPTLIENEEGELAPQGEIKIKQPAGTVVKLPKAEAERALKLKIATVTDNTFAG